MLSNEKDPENIQIESKVKTFFFKDYCGDREINVY